MWALQLYIGLFAKLPVTIPGALGVHFSICLQPWDQHPVIYITTIPGPLFILSPRATIFHTLIRYACAYSQLSNTCSYIQFSSDIVHVRYLVFMCVGTWSSYIDTTPSGIYSTLACSISHCIAFTFPVTPSDIGLQDPHSQLCSTHTSIFIFGTITQQHSYPHELSHSQHLLALFDTHVVLHYPLGMGVPIVFSS